ncbi:bacillithiol biosynthesis cysteine-adding enzyme BshC [Sediminitomix flava]|uniref:Putative cysteine ligase BshC n=2 Tax=Sediminitomix flava TaxID=379075 RepID=A0A315ZGR9_SEDFL|nr:bacillithiol biosynthesis cysteine-adding enzyme BshC [Sediminitomix flava]
MEGCCIPFEKTGFFSNTFNAYINNDPSVKPFIHRSPSIENFPEQIKDKVFSKAQREVLVNSLKNQYEKYPSYTPQIERLLDENTFTVTTGHQLNIFTGPLYFIYKIVTVIEAAKELKAKYPQYNFVPVYWMASEDHDFEEISYFCIKDKKYVWENDQTGAVGRMNPKNIEAILDRFKDMPDFFKSAYQNAENLTEAVRAYTHYLFEKEGLICVDGDDVDLKASFKSVMKKDIFENLPHQWVEENNQKMEEAGFKTQIYARPINFFYLKGELRNRIEQIDEDTFQVVDTAIKFSKAEMEAEIENHPERFSPNVVLRPLYQEMILPNLSYTGGPAEVVYWFQLKELFDQMEVPFPILLPRNFALVITEDQQRKLAKTGFSLEELFQAEHLLKREFAERNTDYDLSFEAEHQMLFQAYDNLLAKANEVDVTLIGHIEAEKKRLEKKFAHTSHKFVKAEQRRQQESLQHLLNLKYELFPGGGLQERRENMLGFYLKDSSFVEKVHQTLKPFELSFQVISI